MFPRIAVFALIALAAVASRAMAAEVVALGASNTHGRGKGRHPDGVDRPQAFPAQLQALLAGQGCRVRVLNAGIPGDTTAGMLRRAPALFAKDTRVLVLQPGGNDARRGVQDSADNIEAIRALAESRGVKVVMLDRLGSMAGAHRLPDGQHFSAEGHQIFARSILSQVASAVCR